MTVVHPELGEYGNAMYWRDLYGNAQARVEELETDARDYTERCDMVEEELKDRIEELEAALQVALRIVGQHPDDLGNRALWQVLNDR